MELNKNVLEDNLSVELREIRRQREELDRREKQLISDMLNEDRENKSLIGSLLEESLQKIFDRSPVTDVLDGRDGSAPPLTGGEEQQGEDSNINGAEDRGKQDEDSKENGLGDAERHLNQDREPVS
jgi:hypothetical protein